MHDLCALVEQQLFEEMLIWLNSELLSLVEWINEFNKVSNEFYDTRGIKVLKYNELFVICNKL